MLTGSEGTGNAQVGTTAHSGLVYATSGYEQSVANLSGMSLSTDNVFSDDGGASQLATATGDIDDGYTIKLPVRVDTSTEPMSGGRP
jgi:hypothetical protein